MFKCFAASILFTLMTSACLSAVPTIKVLQDNAALCPRASVSPVIDGRLDDACWRSGPRIARFMRLDEYKPAREQTSVYLACDDQALYVAFKCAEPEMSKLSAALKTDIWHDDSVEVFIDPTRDRRHYVHFVVSAAGVKYQEIGENVRENLNQRWEAQWHAAVSLGANEWSAEIRIPWATLGVTPQNGIAIRANFGRNELGLKEVSTWNVMPGGFHQPLMFGNVILGDKASAIVTDLTLPGEAHTGEIKGDLTLINTGRAPVSVSPIVQVLPSTAPMSQPGEPSLMEPGWKLQCPVTLDLPEAKLYNLDVFVQEKGQDDPVFVASYQLNVPPAPPEALGAMLNETDWGSVWEACATFKVMPDQKPPTSREQTIAVSAAKNEFEPFQIVLTPRKVLRNLRASVSDLKGNETIPSSRVSIKLVETVPVTIPTSPDCLTGDYPDPLPTYKPTDIPAGKNTALWFTVYVPTDAAAGDYRGTVTLEADGISPVTIPVALHVWNFALPQVSHLRTAYGHDPAGLSSWQGVSNPEDRRKVAELLNQDFIEHRISPYTPMSLWDPKVEVSGDEVKVDWTEFDKGAAMFLPNMNSFNLPFAWLGDFFGAKQGTPEYRKLKGAFLKNMAAHLKEKGWFDKGYIYIFDEPVPDQYQMIVEEAQMWHDADPDYKVLLTEQPEKELIGVVDIYVPVLPNYNEQTCKERQKAGKQVWWYVCCGPHHPFPNNFIDYPALDHRILHWMNWKYGVTGVLYWTTQWWQDNPWTTPMSYTPDHSGKWGNGDGHLLYPAVKEKSKTPLIAGPVDSIRWEMIREGVEDYDYFYMLDQAIKKCEASGTKAAAVEAGKQALAQVDSMVRDRTDYEKDPRRLYAVRTQVAEALERLAD